MALAATEQQAQLDVAQMSVRQQTYHHLVLTKRTTSAYTRYSWLMTADRSYTQVTV